MLSHVYAIANPCTGGCYQSESAIYIERRGNLTRHSKVHSLRDYSGVLLLRFLLFCCRLISISRASGNNRPQISGFFFLARRSRQKRARHPQNQFLRQAVCVSIMKLTLFTIFALCVIAVRSAEEEEYDYEEEVAAPVTPAPTKRTSGLGSLLSSRGRANVPPVAGKKRVSPTQSTTSKPIEQVPEEDDVEGDDEFENSQDHEAPTTTTESAKKLRNGGVRPFRSNEDLLAALKRRRAQTGPSSHPRETASTPSAVEHTTAKTKATTNNRNKASIGSETRTSGRSRFGGKGSKATQEEVEETQQEEVQVKPKAYRRG
ncbi:uncharacterized protein LOC114946516 [Nylanderia fulva]|uniref:uncharacterized protein LOC114946516 n=1 Tax=Nylanderia fulva TaxID=613905 RepID=UPI0010FB8E40|nr:uncharacterized protein LOC114946516 [Nylanderia fulva]